MPKCKFRLELPHGVIRGGKRLKGVVVCELPSAIERADALDLHYTVTGRATYGSGKSRSVVTRTIFTVPMHVDIPEGGLSAGTHRYPFEFAVPAWVPPPLDGPECSIEHSIKTRLDVDWAIDPKAEFAPAFKLARRPAERSPLTLRTPPSFHKEIVLELSLATKVWAEDEALQGTVALRAGHDVRFEHVLLTLAPRLTIRMARGEHRLGDGRSVKVPADWLRAGDPVSFEFPAGIPIPPTFHNGYIDNDVILAVSVAIPWRSDPELVVVLDRLPAGSKIHGAAELVPVGSERLRETAAAMSHATGLPAGSGPVLVDGAVGPVRMRVIDAPRDAEVGVDVELSFPDVELGMLFRPRGLLDGRGGLPLPEELARDWFAKRAASDAARGIDDATVVSFLAVLLSEWRDAAEIRLSDRGVAAHFVLGNDDARAAVDLATHVKEKARAIAKAVAALPFPASHAPCEPAWRAAAAEGGAFLAPSGPTIVGLTFGAALTQGEQRSITVTIHTHWSDEGAVTRAEIDLGDAPIPATAAAAFDDDEGEDARDVRAMFPKAHLDATGATLERPGFTSDPRTLAPGIEAFLSWVLAARGEKRSTAAYR